MGTRQADGHSGLTVTFAGGERCGSKSGGGPQNLHKTGARNSRRQNETTPCESEYLNFVLTRTWAHSILNSKDASQVRSVAFTMQVAVAMIDSVTRLS